MIYSSPVQRALFLNASMCWSLISEMKDLGMMHYLSGLEVWHRTDEIFLSQGKYTIEILKKFGMLNCKPMATPMVMNLKKLSVSSSDSDEIDSTLYR
jgi:hypothetical protein